MLDHLRYFGGFLNMPLNTSWHGINIISILQVVLVAMLMCTFLTGILAVRKQQARLVSWALTGTIMFATAAYAANTALSALSASGALAGANLIYVVQTVGSGGVKATMTQVATFIYGLMSGDCTATGGGAITCTKINGSVPVTSVTGGIGITASPTTGAVTVSSPVTTRNNTATTDTITNTDRGTVITESNASPVAVAITNTGFVSTDYITVKNEGAGLATYTPSSGNIDGLGTLTLKQNQSTDIYFDGTNWWTLPGRPTNVACGDVSTGTCTIASGTAALGTGAITSATCATVVTVSATNVATTDVVTASFNSDPTAVTGYTPSASGMLTIIGYPTSGNVNFKVCNNTSGSITPGAITLNWRVVR